MVTSDPDTSRPVVRLAVVPRNPTEVVKITPDNKSLKVSKTHLLQVAPSITHRLEGRPGAYQEGGRGKEGDQSVMALRSR